MQRSTIASAAIAVLVGLPACSFIIDTNPDGVIDKKSVGGQSGHGGVEAGASGIKADNRNAGGSPGVGSAVGAAAGTQLGFGGTSGTTTNVGLGATANGTAGSSVSVGGGGIISVGGGGTALGIGGAVYQSGGASGTTTNPGGSKATGGAGQTSAIGGIAGVAGIATGGLGNVAGKPSSGGAASTGGVATGGVVATGGAANINECATDTHQCDANATCNDLAVGYQCRCIDPFVGDGRTCRSCAIKNGGCDSLTTCSKVGNTLVCGGCPSGYLDTNGDGTLCSDIDECAAATHNCDANAKCSNTSGSFSCVCPTGWFGDGTKCKAGVKSISITGATNCAVKYDGTIWCWGALGFGPTAKVNPVPVPITSMNGWDTFFWGAARCGTRAGELYCWGYNSRGAVGNGSTTDVDAPVRIGQASDWSWVSGNGNTTCGIHGGMLFCWGLTMAHKDFSTQEANYLEPQQWSALSGWQSVHVGGMASCGIRAGELYCWGTATTYTLGDGTTQESILPIRIGSDADWTTISGGCGVRAGQLYCWGDNYFGRIGNGVSGSGYYHTTPTKVGVAADWSIASSEFDSQSSCGIRGGQAFCWGHQNSCELGIGTDGDVYAKIPTNVNLDVNWQTIYASCGLADYRAYCWGNNGNGQLGDGTVQAKSSPVEVVFP